MIVHKDVIQGTPAWRALRCGIPTASCFDKIVTPAGKISKGATQRKYMATLLAEWILGYPIDSFSTKVMDDATTNEPKARKSYMIENPGVTVTEVGIVTSDDGLCGASPDGLGDWENGDKSGLEIKCPIHSTHVNYMVNGIEDEYKPQVQGGLLVCEDREFWDTYSWCSQICGVTMRSRRDERYIATLRDALKEFTELMLAKRLDLEQRYGPFVRPEPEQQDEAIDSLGISDEDVTAMWNAVERRAEMEQSR